MTTIDVITGNEFVQDVSSPLQALVNFYAAFNNADLDSMRQNWAQENSVVMANPLGDIKTGWQDIEKVYRRIFANPGQVYVEYYDFRIHHNGDQFFAVGRERGYLKLHQGKYLDLAIRTSRIYQKIDGVWRQYHHHGSIDNPDLLQQYQSNVNKA